MLRVAVLVCLLVAVTATQEDECCSHDDRMTVLNQWESVWSPEFLHRRVTIAQEIFRRFFELAPEAKALFTNVQGDDLDSDDFIAHCVRIGNGLDLLINMAYNTDILHEQLLHLGHKHAAMEGVTRQHFELFRQVTEEILPQAIPCFDTEAWERCIAVDHHIIERQLAH